MDCISISYEKSTVSIETRMGSNVVEPRTLEHCFFAPGSQSRNNYTESKGLWTVFYRSLSKRLYFVPLFSLVLSYKAKLKRRLASQKFGCISKNSWTSITGFIRSAVIVASLKLGYNWLGLHFTVWFELFLIVSLQKQIWRSKVRFVPLLVKTWFSLTNVSFPVINLEANTKEFTTVEEDWITDTK